MYKFALIILSISFIYYKCPYYIIYLNIFKIFSEITETILTLRKNFTVQQLNLSNTNKCLLDKRKVTKLGFEHHMLQSRFRASVLTARLSRSLGE